MGIQLALQKPGQAEKRQLHVSPKIKDHSEQGAYVNRDINHLSLILKPGEIRQENQVPGRGHRQKLGKSLNNRNKKQVGQRHIHA
ncbi:hypothetical protein GCM10011517_20470 [Actibacterium pelagium]|uniref:Uncharacterized protein n=1 Tax=Actibacterium pelagium TaxID=2029103 RepID=A0A917AHN3_9RHOB|nr:hypothetical protein GCM10011517_20470 [Actibacterium pelagium]